jgi:hypothetical protein
VACLILGPLPGVKGFYTKLQTGLPAPRHARSGAAAATAACAFAAG